MIKKSVNNHEDNNYISNVLLNLQRNGFGEYVCHSLEEAKLNDRRKNIVVTSSGVVYLTYKYKGEFGDFACLDEHFYPKESIPTLAICWARSIFRKTDEQIDREIENGRFMFPFTSHDYEPEPVMDAEH